jgi:RNA polymerase sigma factor (TIGR02999 family)
MRHAVDTTELLVALRQGEPGALDDLMPRVYGELRRIAHRELRRRGGDPTLGTTALVHEVYLKLIDQTRVQVVDRAHFLALTARAMRQVIIDYARRQRAGKRGGGWTRIPLEGALGRGLSVTPDGLDDLLALDGALRRLRRFDERLHQVVECRYFGGMTVQETAQALDVAPRTVDRAWQKARAWLHREIHATE